MKEAIITDRNGRYIEPTPVADSVTGIFEEEHGYTVAIRPPDGLYQPTFDVAEYRKAQSESQQVDEATFWRNGLTDKEIEALHAQHQPEPSALDAIGKQLVEKELEVAELKRQGEAMGASLVAMELRILELEGNKDV